VQTGIVKWFNNAKGFGFIIPESGGGDVFAHYSSIEMDGYKTLKAGQTVVFELEDGPKGMHAINIQSASSEKGSTGEASPEAEIKAEVETSATADEADQKLPNGNKQILEERSVSSGT